jgi:thioesterase domain-containing protein
LELFLPLISGGRLVIASRDDARDPQRLMDCLRDSKCNVLQGTPASWRGLLDESWTEVKNLRALCGGEALSRDLADQLLPRVAELWNLYGPTETTVWSAVHRVTAGNGPVFIGHPIDNTDVYVLDKNGKLLPVGVAGELHIGGAGVARGYLRREELTAERFAQHPFVAGQKVYRTGDLARWNAEGALECLGRIDNQIKIRGFRIEPGEIEAALMDHEDVRAAAVRVWPDASGNLSIAAYVVGHAHPESLRGFLQQKLPEYMIPARLIPLDTLPMTPNGKVDRNALPEPAASTTFAGTVAPRNEMERKLVGIWESVLDVRPIGIDNNFFDLGGHSFLVAKLLRKIDSEFGETLSMASVFEAPTISRLAEMIGDKSSKGRTQQVVTLQSAGTREPIFWIHGGPLFRPLSNHLGTNRPFLGVSFASGEEVAGRTLPQLAEGLVRTIRAAQPHGPYHLGGWCISGLLAYEAASQLIDAGEKVALVAMLDALNPTHYRAIPKYRVLASKAVFHLKRLLHRPIGEMFTYGAEHSKSLATQVVDRSPAGDGHNLDPAAIAYDPKPISAPVLHIQPVERPQGRDLRVSWASFLSQGNLEIRDVPGDHVSILMEPQVGAIARCINRKLQDNVVEIRRAVAV